MENYVFRIVQAELNNFHRRNLNEPPGNGEISAPLDYDLVEKVDCKYEIQNYSCLPLNPASFSAEKEILDELLRIKNFDPQRKFVPIYMDGGPYGICQKIIATTFICEMCRAEVTDGDEHAEVVQRCQSAIECTRKYNGMIIQPGM